MKQLINYKATEYNISSKQMEQLRVICMIVMTGLQVTYQTQYFSTTPKYTEVNPGSSVVLNCVVSEKSSLSECVWQHDRQR